MLLKIFRVTIILEVHPNVNLSENPEKLLDISKKLFVLIVGKVKSSNVLSKILEDVDVITSLPFISVDNLETCIDLFNIIIKIFVEEKDADEKVELVKAVQQRLLNRKIDVVQKEINDNVPHSPKQKKNNLEKDNYQFLSETNCFNLGNETLENFVTKTEFNQKNSDITNLENLFHFDISPSSFKLDTETTNNDKDENNNEKEDEVFVFE